MTDLFVRDALPDDADTLDDLERQARQALVGVRGGDRLLASLPAVGRHWRSRCADPRWQVAVAGLDGVVLGYVAAELAEPGGVAVIEQVYVHEGAREVGLGDALVERVLERLREAGASAVDATALPGDRQTKNLFERNGLTARLITVTRPLT